MQITIRGQKHSTPKDVAVIRKACIFMGERVMKPSHAKTVTLHVTLTSLKDDFGDVSIEEAPLFRIRLHHEMDTPLMLLTLAHEMIHLGQVMDGRLFLKKNKDLWDWRWMGRSFGCDPYADTSRVLPWEADANEHEVDLACQFFAVYVTSLNGS